MGNKFGETFSKKPAFKGKRHARKLQEHDNKILGEKRGDDPGTAKNQYSKRRWKYNKEWESLPEFKGQGHMIVLTRVF